MEKANTLSRAWAVLDPEVPLPSGDERYVDLSAVRGGEAVVEEIARRIRWTDETLDLTGKNFVNLLVTGHRGNGKSTELLRLKQVLEEDGYLVVYFVGEVELNLGDVEWSDILLTMVSQVVEQAKKADLRPDEETLERIVGWLAQELVKKEVRREQEIELVGQFGVDASLPFFAKVLAAIKGAFRTGAVQVREIRREVERRASGLLKDINDLIDDLQRQLETSGRKGLVIIVDDLEKIVLRSLADSPRLTTHSAIFVEHGEHLKTPHCHLIYTMPVSLLSEENVGQIFPDTPFVIPVVKVRTRTGQRYAAGVRALCQVVERRVDTGAVFELPKLLEELALTSGGHLRDFLRLVRYASQYATADRIDRAATKKAVSAMIREYDRLVKDADLPKLVYIARERRLPRDAEYAHLPYHLLVLEYRNEEAWADVHPLVARTAKFKERLINEDEKE